MVAGQKEHGSGDAPRCLPCETGYNILRAVEDRGGAAGDTGFAAPVVRPCRYELHKPCGSITCAQEQRQPHQRVHRERRPGRALAADCVTCRGGLVTALRTGRHMMLRWKLAPHSTPELVQANHEMVSTMFSRSVCCVFAGLPLHAGAAVPVRQSRRLPQAPVQGQLAAILHGKPGGEDRLEANLQRLHRLAQGRADRSVAIQLLRTSPCGRLLEDTISLEHLPHVIVVWVRAGAGQQSGMLSVEPLVRCWQTRACSKPYLVSLWPSQGGGISSTAARAQSSAQAPCSAHPSTTSKPSCTPSRRCQEAWLSSIAFANSLSTDKLFALKISEAPEPYCTS